MKDRPICFISYSWDSDAHRLWVRNLASKLRQDGIDARLDNWDTSPGDQLPGFMEKEIRESDYVLIICTARYKTNVDSRKGGVGYEGDVIAGEMFVRRPQRKFIPILREGTWENTAPSFLMGIYHIDLSADPYSEEQYRDLLNTLLGLREKAPELGTPPDQVIREYVKLQRQIENHTWKKFEVTSILFDKDIHTTLNILGMVFKSSLNEVFANNYVSFTMALTRTLIKKEYATHKLFSIFGHQEKFIHQCLINYKKFLAIRQKSSKLPNDNSLTSYLDELNEKFSDWLVDISFLETKYPTVVDVEYNPDLKRIRIIDTDSLPTNPVLYDNKVKNTSEAIAFAVALSIPRLATVIGNLGWLTENLPLQKLVLSTLENKPIDLMNFRFRQDNPEQWDFVNPEFEMEIRGYY